MKLKRKLRHGERPIGGWCALPSPDVAEAMATADFDFLTLDTEHSAATAESITDMLRAVEAAPGNTEALVRVADVEPARVKRVLDAGPAAIMAPQIDTPAAARAFVEACRYPPQMDEAGGHADGGTGDGMDAGGTDGDADRSAAADRVDADGIRGQRGVAGSRASAYGRRLGEYVQTATEEIAVIAQIETPTAVASAGEIASVPGIDALFVGPADLSASHGRFGAYDDPVVEGAVTETITAANDAGVPVGTLATSEALIDHWSDAGYDFLIVGTDLGFLASGADRAIERYREGV